MAEISDQIFERYIDKLDELMSRGVPIGKDLEKLVTDFKSGLISGAKSLKQINDSMKKYDDQIKKGRVNAKDLGQAIKQLENSIDDLDDGFEKSIANEKLRELKRKQVAAEQVDRLKQESKASWNAIKSETGSSLRKIASNMTDSAAGFEIAGELLQLGITAAGQGGKLAGTALTGLGTTIMSGPMPQMKIFGGALALAGMAVSLFTDTAKQAASTAADIVIKQSNELLKGFETASQAGVTLAGGMTEFKQAAVEAQLTVSQLADVTKANAESMAASGLTVSGAVKRLGEVGKALAPFRDQLLSMGVGFQEQMEITTKVLADARRVGIGLTDQQAAMAVRDYAKNLRLIADITGEDAKKRQDEARKQTEDFEFRRRLMEKAREMGPEAGAAYIRQVVDSLALMPEVVQRGIKQQFVGGAITDIGVIMTGQVDAAKKFTGLLEDGSITVERAAKIRGEAADKFMADQQQVGRALGRASALSADVAQYYKDFTPLQLEYMKGGTDAISNAIVKMGDMGKPTDDLTKDFVAAQKNMRDMQQEIQTLALKGMPLLANATAMLTEAMVVALRALRGASGATLPTAAEKTRAQEKAQEDRLLSGSSEFKSWQQKAGGGTFGMYHKEFGVDAYRAAQGAEAERLVKGFYAENKIRRQSASAASAGAGFSIANPEGRMVTVKSRSGFTASVAADQAPKFQALLDYMDSAGYNVNSMGGYNNRNIAGTSTPSQHSRGWALDINPSTNALGSSGDMPADVVAMAKKLGLGWGGDWKSKKDPMHFSAAESEGGTARTPMSEETAGLLRTAMEELISVNKDNRDYLEKIYNVSS